MNKYELMAIYKIDLGQEQAQTLSGSVRDLVVDLGGKVLDSNFMGKKKFAYPINHDVEGFYDLIGFEILPAKLETLKNKLNLQKGLVRYLVTVNE